MAGMTRQTWSVNGLATELKMDRRTIASRLDGVAPAEETPKGPRYWMRDAVNAVFFPGGEGAGERLDPQQEKARLDQVRRLKAELELAQLEGRLIPAELVERGYLDVGLAIRAKIIGVKRWAPKLEMRPLAAVEGVLDEFAEEALSELAEFDPGEYSSVPGDASGDPPGDGEDGPASEANGERVGGSVSPPKSRKRKRAGAVADK